MAEEEVTAAADTAAANPHRIIVLVVRHGEREDEASYQDEDTERRTSYRKASKQDRVDPKLTPLGYQQAALAWANIRDSLLEAGISNGIAVFSSPLRRAVGTAMMMSVMNSAPPTTKEEDDVATSKPPTPLVFTLPSAKSMTETTRTSSRGSIPIVIHNSLCNCTALAMRMGGYKNLVRTGLLNCADVMSKNDGDTSSVQDSNQHNPNPMSEELQKLKACIQETCMTEDEHGGRNVPVQSVQFWSMGTDSRSGFSPLAPPVRWKRTQECETLNEDRNEASTSIPEGTVVLEKERPVDQIVRLAMNAGCRVVVIASHREEIRDLYKQRCKATKHRFVTSYCCVGQFEVLVDDESTTSDDNPTPPEWRDPPKLQWILHGVTRPEDLTTRSISDMVVLPGDISRETVEITWPVIERTTLTLCEANLIVDAPAKEASVRCVRTCTMTGADKASDTMKIDRNSSSYILSLQIVKGHHSWLEFLGRLCGNDVASGTMEMELTNGQRELVRILLWPDRQPELPCPPKTIHLDVIR